MDHSVCGAENLKILMRESGMAAWGFVGGSGSHQDSAWF